LICFDNAHPVTVGSGPARKRGARRCARTAIRARNGCCWISGPRSSAF
jgi:hypothetical protein